MMLGMQILRVQGTPPPPLGPRGSWQASPKNTRKLRGFGHPAHHWQPQQPSALIRDPKEDQVADCHLHARLASADLF